MSAKRRLLVGILRGLLRLLTRTQVNGRENLPLDGPLIVAFNHMAHFDGPLVMASLPWEIEAIALAGLYEVPVVGRLLRLYGVIPVHRDEFDRQLEDRKASVEIGDGLLAGWLPFEADKGKPCVKIVKDHTVILQQILRQKARLKNKDFRAMIPSLVRRVVARLLCSKAYHITRQKVLGRTAIKQALQAASFTLAASGMYELNVVCDHEIDRALLRLTTNIKT